MPQAQNCEPNFALKMYQEHAARYLFASQICQGKTVLDIGCGVGYGSHILCLEGASRVIGFDIAEDAIDHARRCYVHPSLSFQIASAESFAFEEKFDVITCFELIEHVGDSVQVLTHIAEALAPGGCAIISTPRRLGGKRSQFHVREFSPFEFLHLLRGRFPHVEFFFENNHFASLVAGARPDSISRIQYIEPDLSPGNSDYMIAVVSSAEIDRALFQPQIVINSDSYVTNLEKDVAILHKAEDDLKATLAELRSSQEASAADRSTLETKVLQLTEEQSRLSAELGRVAEGRDALLRETAELKASLAGAQEAVARLTAEQTARAEEWKGAASERDELTGEVADLKASLADSVAALRSAEETVARLTADQSSRAEDWRSLAAERDALVREVSDLCEKQKELETELDRYKESAAESTQLRQASGSAADPRQDESLQRKFETAQHRIGSLQASLKAANWEIASLQRKLAERDGRESDVLARQMTAVTDYAIAVRRRMSLLEDRLHALSGNAVEQSRIIRSFREQLGNVVHSWSWKLTVPLRAFGGGGLTARALESAPAGLDPDISPVPSLVSPGWSDEELYLRANPDVAEAIRSGYFSSGFEHWLLTGWSEVCQGRRPYYKSRQLSAPGPATPSSLPRRGFTDVVFIIGCHDGESKRYRVFNLMEFLSQEGYSSVAFGENDIPEIVAAQLQCHTFAIFRSAYNEQIAALLHYARLRNIRVVFDIDDLVFEPQSIEYVRALATFTPEQVAGYRSDLERYRRVLLEADLVTCTTEFLANRARALGKATAVIPNSLNTRQMELAESLLLHRQRDNKEIRIGYFSGSNTHQVDFQACEQALLTVMKRYPQCRFVLTGILDLSPKWAPFQSRIERHALVPYTEMLSILAGCDINLAPLELGNPYCEGKSQLKIFEAGLVEVPTVASATQSYAEAVDHGVDGFLAEHPHDWLEALTSLIESPELRQRVGLAARERAVHQFGLAAAGKAVIQAYELDARQTVQAPAALVASAVPEWRRLKIAWIVPGLIIGGGGHRNILRAAYHLQRFGHDLELYFTDVKMSPDELVRTVQEHFYPIDCPMHLYNGEIGRADVLFATHWSTVGAALKARANVGEVMYFVQDFEPLFAPMGTEYVLAENTYRQGLYCITSGPWCERILRRDFHAEADHFQLPVDTTIYHPRPRKSTRPNLLFFAKPEMPRRCFDLGIIALEQIHQRRPDLEIILYGSRNLEGRSFPFPATVRSIVPTLDDLAEMYSSADAGIVFSTTNPSLVPYEMMACGLPVVDLNREGNEINYDDRFDIALLADPSPSVMAYQVCDLLSDPVELAARSRAGKEFVRNFPTEEQMAKRVEELILRRVAAWRNEAGAPAHAMSVSALRI